MPAFEDTWIECLGDLGGYRMAIEEDDIRDREIWTMVWTYWYSKAIDEDQACEAASSSGDSSTAKLFAAVSCM